MTHQKREGSCYDEDGVVKRAKTSESVEKETDHVNREVSSSNLVPTEPNGENDVTKVNSKNNQIMERENSSEDKVPSTKELLNGKENKLTSIEAGAAEDKGCRQTMEDASVVLPDASLDYPGNLRCAHFAIYDGHGGRMAAEYAQKHVHKNVLLAGLPRELMDIKAAKKAILEGFGMTDEQLLIESSRGNWQDGATAVCVWVLEEMVIVANIGDAKAVLARSPTSESGDETPLKAIVLTREHKAIFPQERARIQKAGGSVGSNGRLQGRLEVSRAFGDRQFKKLGVTAVPDVHSFELKKNDHFIILGCDGLWGVFGPNDAIDFVRRQLKETSSATVAVRRLVREAVRERRCKDNCTAILIVFKH